MNAIACTLGPVLLQLLNIYMIVLVVYAVISWIPDLQGAWVRYLAAVIDPVLNPIRRVIPPMGGFDIAFIVLILLIQFVVRPVIFSATLHACAF
ncbi:MAG: YggT family protein [Candidatus Eremiobacteraeota bacterium]|nr:YggT family protein [Candidatus Eremiobacteraeota bacterium]